METNLVLSETQPYQVIQSYPIIFGTNLVIQKSTSVKLETKSVLISNIWYEALQDWASMWVSQCWTKDCSSIWEGFGPISGMWTKPSHTACGISKKLGHVILSFVSGCFYYYFFFKFFLTWFWFINRDPQRSEFSMVFKISVNISGEQKALAVCGGRLNLGPSTRCVWYLALSNKKLI